MGLGTLKKRAFEKNVRKGENAGNYHFLPFPHWFFTFAKQISNFQPHLFYRLQMLSISTSLRLSFGKKLTLYHTITTFNSSVEELFRKH